MMPLIHIVDFAVIGHEHAFEIQFIAKNLLEIKFRSDDWDAVDLKKGHASANIYDINASTYVAICFHYS